MSAPITTTLKTTARISPSSAAAAAAPLAAPATVTAVDTVATLAAAVNAPASTTAPPPPTTSSTLLKACSISDEPQKQQQTKSNNNNNNINNKNNSNNNNNNNNKQIIANNSIVDDKAKMVHDSHKSATNVVNANAKDNNNANNNTSNHNLSNTNNNITNSGSSNNNNNNNNTTFAYLPRRPSQFTPMSDASNASFSSASVAGSIQDDLNERCSLTQAGLEEYNIRYQPVLFHHQKQSSYAQSEGYHSYVSSSDSSSATPLLDRLRQESDLLSRQSHHWSQNDLTSVSSLSVASSSPTPLLLGMNGSDASNGLSKQTAGSSGKNNNNNSSESTSSTETLKWLGSMSDVSEASHATGYSAIAESVSSSQLIVHSSRVLTPKRHHSESVLYLKENEELTTATSKQQSNGATMTTSMTAMMPSAVKAQLQPALMATQPNHRHSPSYPPVHTTSASTQAYHKKQQAFYTREDATKCSLITAVSAGALYSGSGGGGGGGGMQQKNEHEPRKSLGQSQSTGDLQQQQHNYHQQQQQQQQLHKSSISVKISNSEAVLTIAPQPPIKPAAAATLATTTTTAAATTAAVAQKLNLSNDASQLLLPLPMLSKTDTELSSSAPNVASHSHSADVTACGSNSSSNSTSSSTSSSSNDSYRNNHRLFPVSTYTEPVQSNTSHYVHHPKPQYSVGLPKAASLKGKSNSAGTLSISHSNLPTLPAGGAQPTWQSVAELINDFEKTSNDQLPQQQQQQHQQQQQQQLQQHPQKYAYLEPSKTHRVSNPALKAFQKNAVQSYFERQQQQLSRENSLGPKPHAANATTANTATMRHSPSEQQLLRTQSYQASAGLPKSHDDQQVLRKSLPNSFAKPNVLGIPTGAELLENGGKPPSPAPPPPPPRSRSLMPSLLRRSSSASDYADFREQYHSSNNNSSSSSSNISSSGSSKLPEPTTMLVKNISNAEKNSFNDCGMPPPPPPPRNAASLPVRRTSSASEYAAMRDKLILKQAAALAHQQHHPQQHAHSPVISGNAAGYYMLPPPAPAICWAPERPPKNPNLRVPSPDLPPPPNAELDASFHFCDEPLPPPPPELLHRQQFAEPMQNALSPNRRNSFAGSSTRKPTTNANAFYGRCTSTTQNDAQTKVPPLVPKKPTTLLQVARPASSLAQQPQHQQTNKAHKFALNGSLPELQQAQPQQPPKMSSSNTRKRPHNPAVISVPPIMENVNINLDKSNKLSPTSTKPPIAPITNMKTKASPPPPPLMPRMLNSYQPQQQQSPSSRCNSKASYLPRQSLDKLNNTDPDHGSYKLTLTSNEDLVAHTKPTQHKYDIMASSGNGKLSTHNVLPDVLPLGVKLQPQSSSPSLANEHVTMRYGSNNNLSTTTTSTTNNSPTHQMSYGMLYPGAQQSLPPPQAHRYSTPTMGMNVVPSSNYARSHSYDINGSTHTSSPTKFITQSTVDLKKTAYNLETTLEQHAECASIKSNSSNSSSKLISPAQSNCSLSSNGSSSTGHVRGSLSTLESTDCGPPDYNERDRAGHNDGRIFRAELVNTSLSTSPASGNVNNKTMLKSPVNRQDSLRENIEKITQLQSQLMSTHLCDSLLNSYGSNKLGNQTPTVPSITEETHAVVCEKVSNVGTQSELVPVEPAATTTPEPPPTPEANTKCISTVPLDTKTNNNTDIDGLKLVQRSELILRVNPTTVETACQTDDLPDCDMGRLTLHANKEESETSQRTTLQPRQQQPIELEYEKLVQEFIKLFAPNQKLTDILKPKTCKPTSAYVSNLFNPSVPMRPTKRDVGTSTLMRMRGQHDPSAERNVVAVELQFAELDIAIIHGTEDPEQTNLIKQKLNELMKQLNQKIRTLTREQQTMTEESAVNDKLGKTLLDKLSEKVRPSEASKIRTYIDDVGHITSLLLSLSERLSQTEASLVALPLANNNSSSSNFEKTNLETKRERLFEQLDEAKRLKADIDRRGNSIAQLFEKHLNGDDCADYDYFINMKAKLIADTRDISQRVKDSEEQLNSLKETLVQSDC